MTDSSSHFQAADSPEGGGFPFSGSPSFTRTSETVINPEGKPASSFVEPGSSHFTTRPDPELQRVLFPDLSLLEAGELPPSPSGLKLAHFEIVDRIGSGGMGSVFLALDLHLQRYVALKILAPSQAREPNSIQRFLNEARSAARLDYDGIARVHYYGEDRGYHFIAFEYVTGTNVRDLILQTGPLNPADAINFTLQVAHALKHTSAAGVVHRDIKPSNIIVNPAGRAKLVDLGLARKESSGSMEDLTAAGTTLGTFDYISPEQAQDPRNVDVRSDIYSLGCTLYHMLTGEPPYPQGTLAQKLLDHQQTYVPNPAELNRRVPIHLAAVTQKMMASDPKKRYQSPESLIRDLLAVANDQGLRGVTPEGLVWSGGVATSKYQFLIKYGSWMAAVATLLLIVYAMEWLDPRERESTPRAASVESPLEEAGPTLKPASTTDQLLLPAGETSHHLKPSEIRLPSSPIAGSEQKSGDLPSESIGSESSEYLRGAMPDIDQIFSTPFEGSPLTTVIAPSETGPEIRIPLRADEFETSPPDQNATASSTPPIPPIPSNVEPREALSPNDVSTNPVVLLIAGTTEKYPTLEAACANARSGSIIELRYNGSLPNHSEKPISINRQLIIKAGKNYRPIVEFTTRRDPDESDTRMITIQKGSLKLVDVDLRLHVNHDVSYTGRDAWTMFSLQDSDQLSLQNVSVTIENPERKPAVMFEMIRSPGGDPEMPELNNGPATNVDPFGLSIGDSFLRGECQAFVVKTLRPGRISIENSLIAAENSLLMNMGVNDTANEIQELEMSLIHSTVITGTSPFRFETGDAPRSLLHTSLTSENSLFALSPIYVAPFVSMSGNTNPVDLRDAISWNGRSNFYHGFLIFRTISDSRGNSESDLSFEDWERFWDTSETNTTQGEVAWSTPWGGEYFSSLMPKQLQIEMDSKNQQDLLATDGTILGANLNQIRQPPAPPNLLLKD